MDAGSSWRRRRCGVAVTIVLAIATGCGERAADRHARTAAASPAARLDLGVVSITARIGGDEERSAGAVLDGPNGLVITTARGIWGATSLKVTTGLAVLHGRIVARDACDDLALVETQPRVPGLVALPTSAQADVAGGGPLVAVRRRSGLPSVSGPDLITVPVRAGSTPARTALVPGIRPAGAVTIAADAGSLTSGEPLLGADGRLAWLLQLAERGNRTTATALPWETIDARLKELRPGGSAVYVGWRRHYRCAAALHRYTAARHPRFRTGDARLNAPVPATRLPGTAQVDG
jgi:hypothetical protein